MATEYEFCLVQYDFNAGNNDGSDPQEPQASQMRAMTAAGWALADSNVAHPFVQALWQRPVGEAQDGGEVSGQAAELQVKLQSVIEERDAAQRDAAQAQEALAQVQPQMAHLAESRDAAQRDAARHAEEKNGLQQALAAQQQRAEQAEARVRALEDAQQHQGGL